MKQALTEVDPLVLPIMPATAHELKRLLSLRNTRNEHLQSVLLLDPASTIALYRRIEQIRPGAAATITDPAHAISLIGLEVFRQIVAQLPVLDNNGLNKLITPAHGYSQAAHAAWYANRLSDDIHLGNGKEIATAALLQNPAILALWHKEPDSAARASNVVRDGVPYDVAFSAELGEPLNEANRRLAQAWHFPKLARDAMGDWDPFNRQPQIVMLSSMLAQSSAAGWRTEESALNLEILEDFLNMSNEAAISHWHQITVDAARSMASLGYPLPAYELAIAEGEEFEEDVLNDPRLPEFGCRKPQSSPPPVDLHNLIADIMRRMRDLSEVRRAVFILPNKTKTELKTRLALGGDKTDGIRQLKLPMAQKSIFSLLLGKQQSIWIRKENRAKFQTLIPDKVQQSIDPDGFYAMSIFANSKPIGILYADGGKQNEANYKKFRLLCQEVSQVIERKSQAA